MQREANSQTSGNSQISLTQFHTGGGVTGTVKGQEPKIRPWPFAMKNRLHFQKTCITLKRNLNLLYINVICPYKQTQIQQLVNFNLLQK